MATENIIINEWQKGIGVSNVTGFSDMRNVDIYSKPGKLLINFATSKKSGSVVTDLVKWFVVDPVNATIYALGDTGQMYRSVDNGETWTAPTSSLSAAHGNGIAVWKGYLFIARDTRIDVYGALPAVTQTLNFQLIDSDTAFHPMVVGQDDILYIGAGKYVASLAEKVDQVFNPASASTYTYTARAVNIPSDYRIKTLAELREKLLLGTFKSDTVVPKYRVGDIFPWDRASTSFNLPTKFNVNGINAMINIGNTVYVQAGDRGDWYATNGLIAQRLRGLPIDLANLMGDFQTQVFPGAVMQHKGIIYFGLGATAAGTTFNPQGVYSLNNTALNFEHTISTGSSGDSGQVSIGALQGLATDSFLIGWSDNASTFGIDKIITTNRYTNYSAYVISPLYHVGTKINPKTFKTLEIQLAKALSAGQGVRISWRSDETSSFTVLHTMDFSTFGAVTGGEVGAGSLNDLEILQVKVELTTTNSSTPELMAVILK